LMRRNLLFPAIILLGAIILGCNSAERKVSEFAQAADKKPSPQQPAPPSDAARRITLAETQELLKNGKAVIIDVRNQASYDQGHIPGAKLIPSAEILNHLDELPRDKTIVTYCS
jgi:3-mercaptopyruvate sulfurtransferase SseA